MTTVIETFTRILIGLRAAIGAQIGHAQNASDITTRDFFAYLSNRIGRATRRLENLFARWKAGTLPKPRAPRPGRTHTPSDHPKLPHGFAWLARRIPATRVSGAHLQHLLTDPAWPEFLEAAPQAKRILRPLLHMLGVEDAPPLGRIIPYRAPKPQRPQPVPQAPWLQPAPNAPPDSFSKPYLWRT